MYTNGKPISYYGCCETDFKARYYNYTQSFKTLFKRHQTELSRLVWRLKDEGHISVIKWLQCQAAVPQCRSAAVPQCRSAAVPQCRSAAVPQCRSAAVPHSSDTMHCQLCLAEKLAILWADPDTTLNKRSELVAKCRHRNKYKLIKIPL